MVFIAGPTAGGKTAAAVDFASACASGGSGRGVEIVNADAMQVYAAIPILSAQPTPEERRGVPHHLFGYLSAAARGSAGRWSNDAAETLNAIAGRGALAIVVGGTGLYFRALEQGLDPAPQIPDEVRAAAAARLADVGLPAFRAETIARDPAMSRLDPNDRQRHVRAWEVFEATGAPLSALQTGGGSPAPMTVAARIVIEPPREEVYAQAEARFDRMLAAGALDEAARLLEMGLPADAPVMKAVGVAELVAHLKGEITLDAARALAQRNTRRLAKRQMTWFRNQASAWPRAAAAKDAAARLATALRLA